MKKNIYVQNIKLTIIILNIEIFFNLVVSKKNKVII